MSDGSGSTPWPPTPPASFEWLWTSTDDELAWLQFTARLLARADRSGGPTACWPWRGTVTKDGYGMVSAPSAVAARGRASRPAHRVLMELVLGRRLEPDEWVDHVRQRGCSIRHCVNPRHLEVVTPQENTLRGDSFAAVNAAKTECPFGHQLVEGNLVSRPDGRRECLRCLRAASAKRRHAQTYSRPCAKCGAAPGERCVGRSGAVIRVAHRGRAVNR